MSTFNRTFFRQAVAAALVLSTVSAGTLPAAAGINSAGVGAETDTHTLTVKNCAKTYRRLKSRMRTEAQRECRMQSGSGGRAIRLVRFTKLSCTKQRNRFNQWQTTVVGRLSFMCR